MGHRARFALLVVLLGLLATAAPGAAGTTTRISVSSTGEQADGSCEGPLAMSADGRYVVFGSEATNLVPGDTNGVKDVFLHDRQTGQTRRISVSTSGMQANDWSSAAAISADGRFVAYTSDADNLVSGDTNDITDALLYEVASGTTRRISVNASGEQGNNFSASSSISADGRFVVFESEATNLVPEEVRPLQNVYLYDTLSHGVALLSGDQPTGAVGGCSSAAVSGDGRYVAFSIGMITEPTAQVRHQVFGRAREDGELRMLTWGLDGHPAQGDCYGCALTVDGRYIVFESVAGNLSYNDANLWSDVFLVDCESGAITRESNGRDYQAANQSSHNPAITPDGRFVAFDSSATNLLSNWTNRRPSVFVHDRETGRTSIVGLTNDGGEGDWVGAARPAISADGRLVAFLSPDPNFVEGDTNGTRDVFVRDRQTFSDVPVRVWSYDWIEACTNAGIVSGYPGGNYRPGESVTRAQMAVYVARGLAGGDASVHVPTGLAEPSFADVGEDHWAYRYIEYAAGANVVQGYPGGDYRPDEVVNRGQMAVYIARTMVSPSGDAALPDPPAEPTFSDVSAEGDWSWCYPHVEFLAAEGIVQGYWNGTYRPEQAVSRDQMAVYTTRAFNLPM